MNGALKLRGRRLVTIADPHIHVDDRYSIFSEIQKLEQKELKYKSWFDNDMSKGKYYIQN